MENTLTLPLSTLAAGSRGWVSRLEAEGAVKRRLLDLGIIENSPVACLFKSARGDIAAYRVKGAVIALRAETAGKVAIDICNETSPGSRKT